MEIADDGPGIPAAEASRVFERFSRGSGAATGDGGTGLGLAIARWAVDLHAGHHRRRQRHAGANGPGGCRIRLSLPGRHPGQPAALPAALPAAGHPGHHPGHLAGRHPDEHDQHGKKENKGTDPMTDASALEPYRPPGQAGPARPAAPTPGLFPDPAGLWARLWPAPAATAPLAVLVGAGIAGLLGAFLMFPANHPGIGLLLVGLAATAATWPVARQRLNPVSVGFAVLALTLLATVAIRHAGWLVALCLLTAFALASLALTGAEPGSACCSAARPYRWPGCGCRPGPSAAWPRAGGRKVPPTGPRATSGRYCARSASAGCSCCLFGALFASADAAFGELVNRLTPNLSVEVLPQRVVAFGLTAGLVLAAAYVALSPPRWDTAAPAPRRSARRFEWAVPIALLDVLFAAFVIVQIAVLFSGDRVGRVAGLTYAEYARQGFAQLLVATMLTLAVIAFTVRRAPVEEPRDRLLIRVLLGTLCVLTLIVVASALRRLGLYTDAYGLTVPRLFAGTIELWLAVVLLLVLAAGVRLRALWLPRTVVASGAGVLLILAAVNPDGRVADRNIDRFERIGKIDTNYLQTLSLDAVPALDRLPEPLRSCSLARAASLVKDQNPWYAANLGAARARRILTDRPVQARPTCPDPPYYR